VFGVSSGTVDEKFQKRKPGPVNHSRWLTTATRILYLYTRTQQPSQVLKLLTTYIVKIYAPTWFVVRRENNFLKGPEIFFRIIKDVKEIQKSFESEPRITDIVFDVLERNSFCCLGENFLASLLFSSVAAHREAAVEKILEIRSQASITPPTIVATRSPKLNFDAEDWSKLIDISCLDCHEPPCARNFSNEELHAMKTFAASPPSFPLHSQSVERAVKLTSEASRKSCLGRKTRVHCCPNKKSGIQA
jgi:hypothetical protein